MVRKLNKFILAILICLLLVNPLVAYAEKELVFDRGNLFTEDQISYLQTEASRISTEYNMDIVIVTEIDAEGKTSREYADDFFDYNGFGVGPDYDGILFLIDMDNSEAYISTSGIGIRYLTDSRIENILERAYDYGLSNEDFYTATTEFLEGTEDYLIEGIPADQVTQEEKVKEPNTLTFMDIIISFIGSSVVGFIFYSSAKASYKTPKASDTFAFRKNSIMNFHSKDDKLINTFVTHRKIPKDPPSGGSVSTTHKSSSGRSHGGGGKKF